MTFCPCCDAEQAEQFPERCPECGARFEHEAELVGEDWKPKVCVVESDVRACIDDHPCAR